MAVTIKDIASVCGVSYSTVSRALSNHPAINEKTRAKITRVAQSMGYKPNAMARSLVMKKSHTLGLLIPDITNPFWPEVAKGVEKEANDNGYQILLCNTDRNESREILYLSTLFERQVDGVIMVPSSLSVQKLISNNDTPVVFLDVGPLPDQQLSIAFDNTQGAYLGTRYLLDLGHRQIAFVRGSDSRIIYDERLAGYQQALQEYQIPFDKQLVFTTSNSHIEDGQAITTKILAAKPQPTAIFAANDMLAIGIIEGLSEQNLPVPQAISVLGFDDIYLSALPNIRLTTIRQPQYQIGKAAAKLLIESLENPGTQKANPSQTLAPELIVRQTCGRPAR